MELLFVHGMSLQFEHRQYNTLMTFLPNTESPVNGIELLFLTLKYSFKRIKEELFAKMKGKEPKSKCFRGWIQFSF